MTITARYAATCPTCADQILPGQSIEWSQGARARHTACPVRTMATINAAAMAPASPARGSSVCRSCGGPNSGFGRVCDGCCDD